MKNIRTISLIWLLAAVAPASCLADVYVLPPDDVDIVGQNSITQARQRDTLLDVARRFDIGQNEIVIANPDVDRWLPGKDTTVFLPSRHILPDAPRDGIVLNVPEMRLYYFPNAKDSTKREVITHPVSIGRMDWDTPLGKTKIIAKVKDPVWRPPESIKQEHAIDGDPLPDVVPAGADNPLGRFALRMEIPGYLIHSTNKPFGVGMRVTHGCVRMYPKDIERLFPKVKIDTPVYIVDQTIKLGWLMDLLYIEVQPPIEEHEHAPTEQWSRVFDLIEQRGDIDTLQVDSAQLKRALSERNGVPIIIAKRAVRRQPVKVASPESETDGIVDERYR